MQKYKFFYKEIAEEQNKKSMFNKEGRESHYLSYVVLGKQKGVYNLTIQSHDALPAQAADLSNPTQNLK